MSEAFNSKEKEKWKKAMKKEMKSLRVNDVWDLVELPKDCKAVGSTWVFKVKIGADGSVKRHKV